MAIITTITMATIAMATIVAYMEMVITTTITMATIPGLVAMDGLDQILHTAPGHIQTRTITH